VRRWFSKRVLLGRRAAAEPASEAEVRVPPPMSVARSFVASAYVSREDADEALAALEQLAREQLVSLDDVALVIRTPQGQTELHQRHGLAVGEGIVGGGVTGVLAGILLGLPVAVPLAGMAVGAGIGLIDTGIDDARMKRLGAELEPGRAILCALIRDADWAKVRERMARFAGELVVVELTPEAEAALAEAQRQAGAGGESATRSE
jgi:uncharacterized membrane protein